MTRQINEKVRNHEHIPMHKKTESKEGQLLKIIENNRFGELDTNEERTLKVDLKLTK